MVGGQRSGLWGRCCLRLPSPGWAASLPCGALRWRGRSHPLPLQPPLPLLLLLSHAEHMVRDPRLLKSQRSSPGAAAWPLSSVFLRVRHYGVRGEQRRPLLGQVCDLRSHPQGRGSFGILLEPHCLCLACFWEAPCPLGLCFLPL